MGHQERTSPPDTMSLLDNLYITYVNLDHRSDRRKKMELELRRAGLKATRQKALLPQEVKVSRDKIQVMQKRTPGAIGCHYSQVECMKKGLAQGKHIMVLEDDLVFCIDIQERLQYIERFLEGKDWDVFWLGGTFHVNPSQWHKKGHCPDLQQCKCSNRKDVQLTSDPRILRTYGIWSTYAYIVNVKSTDKVLKLLDEHVHESMGIDWLFIRLQPQLECYSFVPGCVKQYDNKSDIGKGMTNFSHFAKLGPYWYQETMHDFDPSTYNWNEAGS
jgi:GR25 family glycosyltransferase involved in LPS biosynthesis